jgi:hypothetical protein
LAWHVAAIGEIEMSEKFLVWEAEGKRPFGKQTK